MEAGEVFVMNCQEFWETMPELGSADERHLRECVVCAARMNQQRQLASGLRAVAATYQGVGAPARVEARLLAAFRAQAGMAAGVRPAVRRAPVFAWAAAVAAMIALGVFVSGGARPRVAQQTAARGVEAASLENTGAAASDTQSDYEGFIPLPNAARLSENEEVNLVRVEVPRSAMIALGMEVSPERATELVAADVMLGPDGLARAVRFLDADSLY
jgi:hypothetical protein